MKYRALGGTGLNVSEIGLGCEHLQGMAKNDVEKVVHAALDAGVTTMDVFMSEPEVRTNIGAALKGRRNKVVLQGHIGAIWQDGQYARSRDMKLIPAFVQDFLTRYQTDYIDVGMVHFVDTEKDYQAAMDNGLFDYARELKAKGVLRAVGASSHDPVIARRLVEQGLIDVLMFSINPAYDILPAEAGINEMFDSKSYSGQAAYTLTPEREALYRACETADVGVTVMKALAAGALLRAESSPFGVTMTPAQCIHYALTRPAVCAVMVGCRTPQEVERAVAYESASDVEKDYAAALSAAPKFSLTGHCMYCNHCLPCPQHIDVAQVNKYLDLAHQAGDAGQSVKEHYLALSAHGGDCIACRRCEANCPFSVPVTQRMAEAKQLFGC